MLKIIKKNKIILIIICALVVVSLFSLSYAFFFAEDEGNENTVSFANLSVKYEDGETINLVNGLPMQESEVDEYATKKSFTVTNTSSVMAYLKIELTSMTLPDSLKSEDFRWTLYEDNEQIDSGSFVDAGDTLTLSEGTSISPDDPKHYAVAFWIKENDGNQNDLLNGDLNTFKSKITVSLSDKTNITTFSYVGNVQNFVVPRTGTYKIEASGAAGTAGNTYSYNKSQMPMGGNGAYISSNFELEKGDELTIVVGGIGNVTEANTTDGTSGAGGGGSFVFKKIDTITNPTYQFSKSGVNYDTLVVAAGGGGSNDTAKIGTISNGLDGVGDTWYSPSNTGNYSTISSVSTSVNTLGIGQFISNDLEGGTFTRSGICTGGYGGGSCNDDDISPGGGWNGTNQATSFSSGNSTTGKTGSNNGVGKVKITYINNKE